MVAAGLSLPGAVIKSILTGRGLLVEIVVPGGLTITVLASGSSKRSRQGKGLIKLRHHLSIGILGDQGKVPVKTKKKNRLGEKPVWESLCGWAIRT